MPVADYFERSALAAAQALGGGFEGTRFVELLETTSVGLAFDVKAAESPEGQAFLDLAIRLLARLYPQLQLNPHEGAEREAAKLAELARRTNPSIDLVEGTAKVGISIGASASPYAETIYAASDGWDAFVSLQEPRAFGSTNLPFGAGAAACLACANLFRRVFMAWPENADRDLIFSTFDLASVATKTAPALEPRIGEEVVLVGVGAIGNAAVWALSRSPLAGKIHLVDDETVEVSNLQRYVLAERADEGALKVQIAARQFTHELTPEAHALTWADFVNRFGYRWTHVLLALDSAEDRRAVQASLPLWIANSWTQPGDLGVSVHSDFTDGACVSCLYLQEQLLKNEDELVAEAIGVPDQVPQVRQFLWTGEPLQPAFLDLVASRLGQPTEVLQRFLGRSVRDLYVEGICGGAVLPLGTTGAQDPNLHVPLAHQSALAGVLLAASYAHALTTAALEHTIISRIDLLRPMPLVEPQRAQKRGDGRCICEDRDYREAHERKWRTDPTSTERNSDPRPTLTAESSS